MRSSVLYAVAPPNLRNMPHREIECFRISKRQEMRTLPGFVPPSEDRHRKCQLQESVLLVSYLDLAVEDKVYLNY